jgi:hypothetical protein
MKFLIFKFGVVILVLPGLFPKKITLLGEVGQLNVIGTPVECPLTGLEGVKTIYSLSLTSNLWYA